MWWPLIYGTGAVRMNFDVIIVGGSFAGLSAALYLARANLSVCVIDTGLPRNRFADQSHGFLTQDGGNPKTLLATARAQVGSYPSVRFVHGKAVHAERKGHDITVALENANVISGARLVLAFGIQDLLPDVPGLKERWGLSVIHCPYCHGYEFGGQELGVLNISSMSVHQALLVSEWGPTTFFLDGAKAPANTLLEQMAKRHIAVEPATVKWLTGNGTDLTHLQLESGRSVRVDALYISPKNELNSHIASQLGCRIDESPSGSIIWVDEARRTSVDGVFAAGDITRGSHSVTFACADGVMAAMAVHRSLVFEALSQEVRT
jgi:thioredoxin reductase